MVTFSTVAQLSHMNALQSAVVVPINCMQKVAFFEGQNYHKWKEYFMYCYALVFTTRKQYGDTNSLAGNRGSLKSQKKNKCS